MGLPVGGSCSDPQRRRFQHRSLEIGLRLSSARGYVCRVETPREGSALLPSFLSKPEQAQIWGPGSYLAPRFPPRKQVYPPRWVYQFSGGKRGTNSEPGPRIGACTAFREGDRIRVPPPWVREPSEVSPQRSAFSALLKARLRGQSGGTIRASRDSLGMGLRG